MAYHSKAMTRDLNYLFRNTTADEDDVVTVGAVSPSALITVLPCSEGLPRRRKIVNYVVCGRKVNGRLLTDILPDAIMLQSS